MSLFLWIMIRLILKVEKNVLKNFSQLQVRKKKNEEEDGKEEDDDDEMHLALASFNVDVLANLAFVLLNFIILSRREALSSSTARSSSIVYRTMDDNDDDDSSPPPSFDAVVSSSCSPLNIIISFSSSSRPGTWRSSGILKTLFNKYNSNLSHVLSAACLSDVIKESQPSWTSRNTSSFNMMPMSLMSPTVPSRLKKLAAASSSWPA